VETGDDVAEDKELAAALLRAFKGDDYVFGLGCFDALGGQVAAFGRRASVVWSGVGKDWGTAVHAATADALDRAGAKPAGEPIAGARPNAPREDVFRIAAALVDQDPDVVVCVGGGSCIDAAKAAAAYAGLGDRYPEIDAYFGVGQVSLMIEDTGRSMLPVVAAQLAAGSAAHLTKYSNITSVKRAQKLLIIDDAIVPPKCLFDYAMSASMSRDFTMDGALDGVAHCLEVYYGASGDGLGRIEPVSLLGIRLIVHHLKTACEDLGNLAAREALGLGTDLGGYAIMLGGTNGAHLASFSLVDVLSHGRACALMNPYYTVFFAPAIEDKLRAVGAVYKEAGHTNADLDRLRGRDLGLAVADAMLALSHEVGFPTRLAEVDGFTDAHVARALTAAKDPKLASKLANMPVPLSAETVDEYMGPILEAAKTGDFGLVKNMG